MRPGMAIDPLGLLYTDFTELVYGGGKAWLMTLVDHVTKVSPGWALGPSPDTALALRVWRRARRWLRRHSFPVAGIIVHHDRDPVYTGYGWLEELLVRDQVNVSFTLNGCRDNPEMESFHSRFKGETGRSCSTRRPPVTSRGSSTSGCAITMVGVGTQLWATKPRSSSWRAASPRAEGPQQLAVNTVQEKGRTSFRRHHVCVGASRKNHDAGSCPSKSPQCPNHLRTDLTSPRR